MQKPDSRAFPLRKRPTIHLSHFFPLVDTIGRKKPAVKRAGGIFLLCDKDLRWILEKNSLWKKLWKINGVAVGVKVKGEVQPRMLPLPVFETNRSLSFAR